MSDVSDMDVEKVPVRGAGSGRNEEGGAPTPSNFAGRVSFESVVDALVAPDLILKSDTSH
jgi:hypothetical protein